MILFQKVEHRYNLYSTQ